MDDVTLVAVHHRKGVAARVFALFGQLHQLGELLVDHLDQGGILFGVGFQKFGIVGLQLGRQVRVANLKAYCEAAVALQRAAFVAAFQGLITFRLAGTQDVTQFDRSAALHLLHGRRQLCGSKPPVVLAEVMASPHLLPVATFAGNFYHFLAG